MVLMSDDNGVLIGDNSGEYSVLADLLEAKGIEVQYAPNDGYEIYQMLQSGSFDIVIINSSMQSMDALRLITLINAEKDNPPFFYTIMSACSEKEKRELLLCGNAFILSPPFDAVKLAERIMLMGGNRSATAPFNRQLEFIITRLIRKLGFPPHLKGYNYLRTALMLSVCSTEMCESITKKLYPEIARLHDTTPQRVERSMRHAISTVYTRGQNQYISEIFSGLLPEERMYPTNHELISALTDHVILQLKYYR